MRRPGYIAALGGSARGAGSGRAGGAAEPPRRMFAGREPHPPRRVGRRGGRTAPAPAGWPSAADSSGTARAPDALAADRARRIARQCRGTRGRPARRPRVAASARADVREPADAPAKPTRSTAPPEQRAALRPSHGSPDRAAGRAGDRLAPQPPAWPRSGARRAAPAAPAPRTAAPRHEPAEAPSARRAGRPAGMPGVAAGPHRDNRGDGRAAAAAGAGGRAAQPPAPPRRAPARRSSATRRRRALVRPRAEVDRDDPRPLSGDRRPDRPRQELVGDGADLGRARCGRPDLHADVHAVSPPMRSATAAARSSASSSTTSRATTPRSRASGRSQMLSSPGPAGELPAARARPLLPAERVLRDELRRGAAGDERRPAHLPRERRRAQRLEPDPAWQLTLTMEHRSYDELSRLWQATTVPLRLGVVYRAAVLFLTPDEPVAGAKEVETREGDRQRQRRRGRDVPVTMVAASTPRSPAGWPTSVCALAGACSGAASCGRATGTSARSRSRSPTARSSSRSQPRRPCSTPRASSTRPTSTRSG